MILLENDPSCAIAVSKAKGQESPGYVKNNPVNA
jgi:hypothetical protein